MKLVRRARRPRVVLAAILVCLSLTAAQGSAAPSTDTRPAAAFDPVPGKPFRQPPTVRSGGGVLDVTLIADERSVSVSGDQVRARIYARQVGDHLTGPTLRVRPGDVMQVTIRNRLAHHTNLHVHGLHVSPVGRADNVFRRIAPETEAEYLIRVRADQPTGLYWYHAHFHHHAEEQVFGGLSGLIVVEGLQQLFPQELRNVKERLFALRDIQVDDGEVRSTRINVGETTRLVNDLLRPRLTIRPGQTQLWRFANIGANVFYAVSLAGHTFRVVAEDGFPLEKTFASTRLLMPPGKRFEVLVQGKAAGTYDLVTQAIEVGDSSEPRRVLATVVSSGAATTPAELPTTVGEFEDLSTLPESEIADVDRFVFRTGAGGPSTINSKAFQPGRIDARARLGTVEEWELVNNSPDPHPFHMHTNLFQVISVGSTEQPARGLQDTVIIPPAGLSGTVTIRIPFGDFAGKTVFHCHILEHEDGGMMATLLIEPEE